jgi:hypothetical protein
MLSSARADRSAWVSEGSEFLLAGEGWGMLGSKLVGNKQAYQLNRTGTSAVFGAARDVNP